MRRVAYCQDISALPLAVSHWLGWEAGKPLASRFVGYNDVECYFKILFKKFLYIMIHGDTYKNKAVTLRRTTLHEVYIPHGTFMALRFSFTGTSYQITCIYRYSYETYIVRVFAI